MQEPTIETVEAEIVERMSKEDVEAAIPGLIQEPVISKQNAFNIIDKTTSDVKTRLGSLIGWIRDKAIAIWEAIVKWAKETFFNKETGKMIIVSTLIGILLDVIIGVVTSLVTVSIALA